MSAKHPKADAEAEACENGPPINEYTTQGDSRESCDFLRNCRDATVCYKAAPPGNEGRARMADHGAMEIGNATGNDYSEHEKSYRFFIGLTKWGSITVATIIILMAIFLL
jgi:hypothetical protein